MKIKLNMDTVGYMSKDEIPVGTVVNRLKNGKNIVETNITTLINNITRGMTFTPGVMTGKCAEYWQQQQLFVLDVDNDKQTTPMTTVDECIAILDTHNLPHAFIYYSFNHTPEKPKFRIVLICEEVITNSEECIQMNKALISLIPQADQNCHNLDRIYFGTKKGLAGGVNEVTFNKSTLLKLVPLNEVTPVPAVKVTPVPSVISTFDLGDAIRDFNLVAYIEQQYNIRGVKKGKDTLFSPNPLTGTKNESFYVNTAVRPQTIKDFSNKEHDGNIINLVMIQHGLDIAGARIQFKKLCGVDIEAEAIEYKKLLQSKKTTTVKAIIQPQQQWEKIIPFDIQEVPKFPIDVLTGTTWLHKFVAEVSEETQTDIALASTTCLSVLATCLQNKFLVETKKGWKEALSLYTMSIMNPSERKSAVFGRAIEPIQTYQAAEHERLVPLIKRKLQEKKVIENKIEYNNKLLMKKTDNEEAIRRTISDLNDELANLDDIHDCTIFCDDITPEKLSALMEENNGNMAMMSAEGGVIGTITGRYSKNGNANIDIMLKAWNREPVRIDRQNKVRVDIQHPALTVGLCVQPCVLHAFVEHSESRERGLCARFLYCTPESKIGNRTYDSMPLSDTTRDLYATNIIKLLALPHVENPLIIALTKEAKQVSEEFFYKMEKRLSTDLDYIRDFAGKLHGQISRLAAILHIVENISIVETNHIFDFEISAETYKRAIIWGEYYLAHAEAIFSVKSGHDADNNATYLIAKLKDKKISEISQRDLQQACRKKLTTEAFEQTLELLQDHNYIMVEKKDRTKKIYVNPCL